MQDTDHVTKYYITMNVTREGLGSLAEMLEMAKDLPIRTTQLNYNAHCTFPTKEPPKTVSKSSKIVSILPISHF